MRHNVGVRGGSLTAPERGDSVAGPVRQTGLNMMEPRFTYMPLEARFKPFCVNPCTGQHYVVDLIDKQTVWGPGTWLQCSTVADRLNADRGSWKEREACVGGSEQLAWGRHYYFSKRGRRTKR